MNLLELYLTFFKIGLFTIGGGLAALPLLQQEMVVAGFVTQDFFVDMIAVSQSTPGPIGINMATYIGYTQHGMIGSLVATLGMVTPSIIIITVIAKFMKHFSEIFLVKGILLGIKPTVIGIILAAAYTIGKYALVNTNANSLAFVDMINIRGVLFFLVTFLLVYKYKHHPIVYILLGGVIGILIF